MGNERKLVWGVGINDADYVTQRFETTSPDRYVNGQLKQKLVWRCPYYNTWKNMLKRCYSEKEKEIFPTYKGCTVSEEWKLFSNFRKWMVEQDWEGMHLDKDLLIRGNKVYSEETCVFVTEQVNAFINERGKARGECPIGVSWSKAAGKFQARCCNPFTKKGEYFGLFVCPWEAHSVWLSKKLGHAYALAAIQTNPRVAKALIDRYENYKVIKGE